MNMFKTEDILAELAAGRSIEDIAKQATEALNAANAEYKKQQEEKAKAEKAAALQKQKKEKAAGDIMTHFMNYLLNFHPTLFSEDEWAEFERSFDPARLSEAIDETVKAIQAIPVVEDALRKAADKPTKVTLTGDDAKKANDAINKFLHENNLF